ncbi:MAG: hypothetical protein AB7P02_02620 [Alphaproteobacteria bacterium]
MKAPKIAAAAFAAALALPMAASAVTVVNPTGSAGEVRIFFPDNQAGQNIYPIGANSYMDISGANCGEGRVCRIWVLAPVGMRQCVVDVANNAATVTVTAPGVCEVK